MLTNLDRSRPPLQGQRDSIYSCGEDNVQFLIYWLQANPILHQKFLDNVGFDVVHDVELGAKPSFHQLVHFALKRCHNGFILAVSRWMDKNCFCPPNIKYKKSVMVMSHSSVECMSSPLQPEIILWLLAGHILVVGASGMRKLQFCQSH